MRCHIRQNTITFGGGIIALWVGVFIQCFLFGGRLEIEPFLIIGIVFSIGLGIAWLITVPSYLFMYVKQKRRIKHCTHLIATGAPLDEIGKYITSFLTEMKWKKVVETL